MLSIPHMIVVFIVVLVVFGPQKLPELARSLGKLMAEFRKASMDFRSAFEEEMRDLERQALQAERKKAAEAAAGAAPAVAEPSQPAEVAEPVSTETSPSDGSSNSNTGASEAPSSESASNGSTADAPVISPVSEAVPQTMEEPGEIKTEPTTPTDVSASHQDATHQA